MNGSQVTIKNVSKYFGDFVALENINFTINKGEFFSLLGPSGCGKTTLLRIIAGFESCDNGAVLLDDETITLLPPNKRQCNTVFQTYALFPNMTVYDNIAFPLRLKHVDELTIRDKVEYYLNLVQLKGHERKKPNQLSGGQKQRVSIARALINEPKVLLLDEPLSALDAKLRSQLLIDLDRLHDKIGITFIFVTHDQSEALSVSDRIAVMNKGHVLQIGTPQEIYEQPATQFVAQFIGETNLFEATVVQCVPHQYPGKDPDYMETLSVPFLGKQAPLASDTEEEASLDRFIQVTDYEQTKPGQKVALSVRPEKIRITTTPPETGGRTDINVFKGIVEEPIYSGFQSKFYVKLQSGAVIKIFKQHTDYMDNGPDIKWKDEVYISWSADDAYVVEDINK